MTSDAPNDLFSLWFSALPKDDPKRKHWQQKFARLLKFGSALSTDWSTLTEAGCNAEVLYALLWEVTSAAQDIVSDYRERVKASKRDTHKALATLSASMNRTSAEIAKHLKLLNQLYGAILEQRKRLLLSAPAGANPLNKPSQTHNPIEYKSELANDFAALYDPAYLAQQLSAWAEALSHPGKGKRPIRKIHDALMFMATLNYVSHFVSKLPFSALARLINAALEEANRHDSTTADQLRMLWNHNRQVSKSHER